MHPGKEGLVTFTAGHGVVPHDVAVLQDAGDGLRAVGLDEALFAGEGHGAAQLQAVPEALPVHWHTGVGALVVAEGCGLKVEFQGLLLSIAHMVATRPRNYSSLGKLFCSCLLFLDLICFT